MPAATETLPGSTEPPTTPKTTEFMLATFADLYRQELAEEEAVNRTSPLLGTAVSVGIGALVYTASRLPKLSDLTPHRGLVAFIAASVLLGLSIVEAACVLVWVFRANAAVPYMRIGSEPDLRTYLSELQAYHEGQGTAADELDTALVNGMRQVLLDAYTAVIPNNRAFNQRRSRFRVRAGSHLVRSLMWVLEATAVIAIADKLGYLPR